MAAKIFMDMPGGIKMPAIGVGTLQRAFQPDYESELEKALNAALEIGYRHIDTAFLYQNEKVIGRVLKEWLSSGKLKREDLFITTKLPLNGNHKDRVEMFLKKSLANLQLDYVDLYLIHFPVGLKYKGDETRPPPPGSNAETEETDHIAIWKKMEEQVDAGRTKTIGLSNFNIRQIDRIIKSARIKPACLQVELNINLQQRELVKFCHENKIVVVAYAALGTPGYDQFIEKLGQEPKQLPNMLTDPTVKKIADKYKKTNAQILLRHLLQKNIVPIPKSTSPTRLRENIDVFDFSLTPDEIKTLDAFEIGEAARRFQLRYIKGLYEHPEWPYPK